MSSGGGGGGIRGFHYGGHGSHDYYGFEETAEEVRREMPESQRKRTNEIPEHLKLKKRVIYASHKESDPSMVGPDGVTRTRALQEQYAASKSLMDANPDLAWFPSYHLDKWDEDSVIEPGYVEHGMAAGAARDQARLEARKFARQFTFQGQVETSYARELGLPKGVSDDSEEWAAEQVQEILQGPDPLGKLAEMSRQPKLRDMDALVQKGLRDRICRTYEALLGQYLESPDSLTAGQENLLRDLWNLSHSKPAQLGDSLSGIQAHLDAGEPDDGTVPKTGSAMNLRLSEKKKANDASGIGARLRTRRTDRSQTDRTEKLRPPSETPPPSGRSMTLLEAIAEHKARKAKQPAEGGVKGGTGGAHDVPLAERDSRTQVQVPKNAKHDWGVAPEILYQPIPMDTYDFPGDVPNNLGGMLDALAEGKVSLSWTMGILESWALQNGVRAKELYPAVQKAQRLWHQNFDAGKPMTLPPELWDRDKQAEEVTGTRADMGRGPRDLDHHKIRVLKRQYEALQGAGEGGGEGGGGGG